MDIETLVKFLAQNWAKNENDRTKVKIGQKMKIAQKMKMIEQK